ncbi:fatty acid-binding protein, brain-like [Asterias rubens]|uniref:fatty acid-binding protein, brain-like n=1 Tax=Asterias rubens TaxID=7604 RepID=UPI001455BBA6|nr:fatty acid-binding protein, brain-like [Asterias rubens]
MAQFNGKFKLDKSEKFDEFMAAMGVNFMLRKVGNSTKPLVTMSTEDGKVFNFLSESTFKNVKLQFTLGVEYSDTTPDGRKTKNVINMVDNKLVQNEKPADGKGKEVTYIREITESGDMKLTCKIDDIVATRMYLKQ